jgi:hypothetical protein
MGTQSITNPSGAHLTISDFRLSVDDDGYDITNLYGKTVEEFEISVAGSATIEKGMLLEFVAPTATTPIRVALATGVADEFAAGVLDESFTNSSTSAVIRKVSVVRRGITTVKFNTGANPTIGDQVQPSVTAGEAESEGTWVLGIGYGTVIAETATDSDVAWVDVHRS